MLSRDLRAVQLGAALRSSGEVRAGQGERHTIAVVSENAQPAAEPDEAAALPPGPLDQVGGITGILQSSLPAVGFVTANQLAGLEEAILTGVVLGVGVLIWRLARRSNPVPAIGGFLGLGFALLVARRTGRAEDFFLPGIFISSGYALVLLISACTPHPLIGYALAKLEGRDGSWRRDPRQLRGYQLLTGGWALLFGTRAGVSAALYLAGMIATLGAVKVTATPSLVLMGLLSAWMSRRIQARAAAEPALSSSAGSAEQT